ncbi:1269_t:CDS:2 [Diversispora eburnea]|uniref:1269_t:CDS:1 n=1 Tax=Diversispora eburnea TaxID=1213867 RepID=A0A9N9AKY7_9GLOM|nr:1269_t:CDS:2 [Diversispora eburnea]
MADIQHQLETVIMKNENTEEYLKFPPARTKYSQGLFTPLAKISKYPSGLGFTQQARRPKYPSGSEYIPKTR